MVALTKITNGYSSSMPIFRILPLILIASLYSIGAHAGNAWKISTVDQDSVAVTPKHNMILKMRKPNKGLWGKLYINLNDEQVKNLQRHRLDKYSFKYFF